MKNAYLPHTEREIDEMLAAVGVQSVDELFEDIPEDIRFHGSLDVPAGLAEHKVEIELARLAAMNHADMLSFMGCGSYDHIIPSVVRHIMARPEFATAYTPYQAEISQGMLQGIFEFQTMMCMLTGHDVSNASLYDGASATVEACSMALAARKKSNTILYSSLLHPNIAEVLSTNFSGRGVRLIPIPAEDGATSLHETRRLLDDSTAAVIVQSPNVFGWIEELNGFSDAVHSAGALLIMSANPLSLGLFRSPEEWGADIAVGDTQVLGIPRNFGGPTAGYLTAREALLRRMPGRIAGQTVDREGKRAFVLTLQAREQHIKRERATSNICTNQALIALANAVYLASLGPRGLEEVCRQNATNAAYLADAIQADCGVALASSRPFFNEFTLRLPVAARTVAGRMARDGILAGVTPEMLGPAWAASGVPETSLTVAVTEKRTKEDMDRYVAAFKEALT